MFVVTNPLITSNLNGDFMATDFPQIFGDRVSRLSLNDWERIGATFDATHTLRF
jgi:hypothetical protein